MIILEAARAALAATQTDAERFKLAMDAALVRAGVMKREGK